MKTANLARTLAVAAVVALAPAISRADWSVGVSVGFAPPPLPVYVQPPCPGIGYLWTPGYWAYDPVYGYYWIPGTWVLAPVGLLWTPGYWAFESGVYGWHVGYWGPVVGFYGGVDYGFGYFGHGFEGGYWDHGELHYNRAVENVGRLGGDRVYEHAVVHDHRGEPERVSFNGGPGGTHARPTGFEMEAARMPHSSPTAEQQRHFAAARATPDFRVSANHGSPAIAATPRAGVFPARNPRAESRRAEAPAASAASAPPPAHRTPPEFPQAARQAPPAQRAEPQMPRAPMAGQVAPQAPRAPAPYAYAPQREMAPRAAAPAAPPQAMPQMRAAPPQQAMPPMRAAPPPQAMPQMRAAPPPAPAQAQAPHAGEPMARHEPHERGRD